MYEPDHGFTNHTPPCRLVIIDAHALLYRVHFSFGLASRLKTRGGQDTSIEYGFINTVSDQRRRLYTGRATADIELNFGTAPASKRCAQHASVTCMRGTQHAIAS